MGIPARRAAVNHSFVSRLRRETSLARPKINPVRTVTRNGTTYRRAICERFADRYPHVAGSETSEASGAS